MPWFSHLKNGNGSNMGGIGGGNNNVRELV